MSQDTAPRMPTGDQLVAQMPDLWDELLDTHVYVHETFEGVVSDDEVAAMSDALDGTDVYVVLREVTEFTDDPATLGDPEEMLFAVREAYAEEQGEDFQGTLLVVDDPGSDLGSVLLNTWGPNSETTQRLDDALYAVGPSTDGVLQQTVAAIDLLDASDAELAEARTEAEEYYAAQSSSGGAPDGDGGDATGWVIGGAVALVAAAAVLWWRSRRASARPSTASGGTGAVEPAGYVLPPAVAEKVRGAHARALVNRARSDLLALGEAIDEHEVDPDRDPAAWQQAVDHYAAGRGLVAGFEDRDEPRDAREQLDVVGAVVLAARGTAALDAALAGRAWEPGPGCLLDPLHEGGVRPVRIDDVGEVPVCARCRAALREGREPDVLDVLVDGTATHYVQSGVEPWASTGFGALDPDLLTALARARR